MAVERTNETTQAEQKSSLRDAAVLPMIARSLESFRRDLPQLLETHYRQWVAYHGDEQIGFGRSQTMLYQECFRRGLKRDEFIVSCIEPGEADEEEEIDALLDV